MQYGNWYLAEEIARMRAQGFRHEAERDRLVELASLGGALRHGLERWLDRGAALVVPMRPAMREDDPKRPVAA